MVLKAEFDPRVRTYWLTGGTIVFVATVVGIPLLLLWLPLGHWLIGRYIARMECVLTERHLKVSKGILVRMEKTIPLGKITDLGMVQGPLMRYFGIHTLSVETAGQSSTGSLVSLTGISGAAAFREAVLAQRDRLEQDYGEKIESTAGATAKEEARGDVPALLVQIRDSLKRIEDHLSVQQPDK